MPVVRSGMPPLPRGVKDVTALPGPLTMGSAHVVFDLETPQGAQVVLCLDAGRMVGLTIRGEISARALRLIPLRSLERYAVAEARRWVEPHRSAEFIRVVESARNIPAPLLALGIIKQPELPPDQVEKLLASYEPVATAFEKATSKVASGSASTEGRLAVLAARYVVLCGESGTPTKALAEEIHVPAATVRDHLGHARAKGLLTRPGPGRAGGELTSKAIALLTKDQEA